MSAAVRSPPLALSLPSDKLENEIAYKGPSTSTTPRHSEGTASMDATEAGSDTDNGAAAAIEQHHQQPRGQHSAIKDENGEGANAQADAQKAAAEAAGGLSHNSNGTAANPRPVRRAVFPSQLTPPGEEQNLPIRPDAEECLFYIHTGWCGYGTGCRYNHPPEKMALHKPKAFNSLGLPLRDGVQNCTYFMRMVSCKFGSTCKFNHPQQTIDDAAKAAAQQQAQPQHAIPAAVQQPQIFLQPPSILYSPASSPSHLRSRLNSTGSVSSSPVLGPQAAPPPYSLSGTSPYGQPVFVYYVQPPAQEPCISFITTGRCQLGYQCPFAH